AHWLDGPIGSTKSCVAIFGGQHTGSRALRDVLLSCLLIGRWVRGVAPWREPYELRGSRTVLRERRGEILRRYSPGSRFRESGGSRALPGRIPGTTGEVRFGVTCGQD